MRDPDRIDPFLAEFAKVWKRNPDMRFGQLFMNLSREGHDFADTWEWENDVWLDRFAVYPSAEEIKVDMNERLDKAEQLLAKGDPAGALAHLFGFKEELDADRQI